MDKDISMLTKNINSSVLISQGLIDLELNLTSDAFLTLKLNFPFTTQPKYINKNHSSLFFMSIIFLIFQIDKT